MININNKHGDKMKQNKKPTKDNTFEIDITPSWGYVAKSLLALIQINYKADINKADYKALKEQLTQMSQVADRCVAMDKAKIDSVKKDLDNHFKSKKKWEVK